MDLTRLPAFAEPEQHLFHVVVESPRGSSLKLKYEPEWQAMSVSRPLPVGLSFPFDWGFVPGTRGPDDDPVDALVVWDVASYPGVVLTCRALGIMHIEQNRVDNDPSARIRNDRILAIPREARREGEIRSVDDLGARVRVELEQFTLSAAALEGKDARVVGWGDSHAAITLIASAVVGVGQRR